ncbi:hypothetical protein [Chlamydia suis]|uniref:Inclusion membrane protein-25 n=1 Tax=Chlamydia suis TaxID=83559 RepID=A0ABX6IR85_9CHLA|nr:hypothetical protein [Chlamydia suis]MCI5642435.1 hypothetical protein [Chlamydia suis]MEB2681003.1 hypothetical protein [Chlamydia suis]MEB2682127.1 hypothetical protein [Chlamydia suis]MEB2683050.1 hypothetical protein [Chlamydia suis]MEB2683711.1 hypothetical protein [Chlamydia suis]
MTIGACAAATISGALSVCLGTLIVGGVLLAMGLLFTTIDICRVQRSSTYKLQAKQELLEMPSIQEEETKPLMERASCVCEPVPPLSGPEDVRQQRPIILRKGSDPFYKPKYITVGDCVIELIKVGERDSKGEKIFVEGVSPDQTFVRVWDEFFILGQEGEMVRLDGVCCKFLPGDSQNS